MSGPTTRVVALGGGHGLAMTLRALDGLAARVTAVVSTADDGGSSGRLRRDVVMPAPGDLRRCLSAVAGDRALAEAMEHRFAGGTLHGHAVGNLVLAGLVDQGMRLDVAAARLSSWLDVDDARIQVVPATVTPVDLVASSGEHRVEGQVEVETHPAIDTIAVEPADPVVPTAALDALAVADLIVLGPGSLFSSVLAAAVVPDIRRAVAARRGRLAYVANLRADEAGVQGLDVAGHVEVLHRHDIRPDVVIAQRGGLALGDVGVLEAVEVVEADLGRPHGLAHDPDLLRRVLAGLLPAPPG